AMRALAPLIRGTANNIVELGTTRALTGPIVRGDVDTVRANMEALRGAPDDRLTIYRMLGRRTLAIARRRGALDADQVAELERLLEQKDG
ncbi:MAG: DUF2520 domain-containing protein, partial [Actinomycetes bacterium]